MTCCLHVSAKEILNRGMHEVNMIDKLLAEIIFNRLNQFKAISRYVNAYTGSKVLAYHFLTF